MLTALGQTLFAAIEDKDLERVKLLLNKGASLSERDDKGRAVLHIAAATGDLALTSFLVDAGAKLEATTSGGDTPLMIALLSGFEDVSIPLINVSVVRKRDRSGSTPLHLIIEKGFKKALSRALECKAVLDRKDRKGRTPYVIALEKKNREIIDIIHLHEARGKSDDYRLRYPLHSAASCQTPSIITKLINAGFSIKELDDEGRTPLARAINKGRVDIASRFLELGASPLTRDKKGNTLVHEAKSEKKGALPKVLEWVLCQGLTIDEQNNKGETALFCVVAEGAHTEGEIKPYLTLGASLSTRDNDGNTLLHVAKHKKLAEFLVQEGLDINAENKHGETPLQCAQVDKRVLELIDYLQSIGGRGVPLPPVLKAISEDDLEQLRLSITSGQDVNEASPNGVTPLILAAYKNDTEGVKTLLRAKADVKAQAWRLSTIRGPWESRSYPWQLQRMYGNQTGMTALHIAAAMGHKEVVRQLLEYNAPLDEAPFSIGTPLVLASKEGYKEVVELLVEAKCTLKAVDGCCPLSLATKGGHFSIVKILVESGFPIDEHKHSRSNSVDIAVQQGRLDIAQYLVAQGAYPHDVWFQPNFYPLLQKDFTKALDKFRNCDDVGKLIDSEGRTALHIAAMVGAVAVIEYLVDVVGMDVNCQEWLHNATPLHLASMMGRAPAVQALLSRGADEALKTRQACTAADFSSVGSFLVGLKDFVSGQGPQGDKREELKEIVNLETKVLDLKAKFLQEADKDYDSYEWKHIGRPIEQEIIGLIKKLRKL